jgi:hypothetical protein
MDKQTGVVPAFSKFPEPGALTLFTLIFPPLTFLTNEKRKRNKAHT